MIDVAADGPGGAVGAGAARDPGDAGVGGAGPDAVAVCVIAKRPVAGQVKTRLVPPLGEAEAAEVASASLSDTLDAVDAASVDAASTGAASGDAGSDGTSIGDRVLYFQGDASGWLREGWEFVAQRSGGLGERLDALFASLDRPAVVIGMDTPQVEPRQIDDLVAAFADPAVDAVFAPAADGGYWAIGFRRHFPGAFEGVPMSEAVTGAAQLRRLEELGLTVRMTEELRDLDHWQDALDIAAAHPQLAVSEAVARLAVEVTASAPSTGTAQ